MLTIYPTSEQQHDAGHEDTFESMAPREQLLGLLVVMLVLLLAILLQSL